MRAVVQGIEEITDSRELLETKPHPVVSLFLYIVFVLLGVALIWSYFGEIDEYVRVNGVVRPHESVATISSLGTGRVKELYMWEGRSVKEGDILFVISYDKANMEMEALESRLTEDKEELELLHLLKESIKEGENKFGRDSERESYYYNLFRMYETEVGISERQSEISEIESKWLIREAELNREALVSQKKHIEETVSNLELLRDSIEQDKSFIDADNKLFYGRYMKYKNHFDTLTANVTEYKDTLQKYEELYNNEEVSIDEVDSIRELISKSEKEISSYKNEYLADIYGSLNEHQKSLDEMDINLRKIDENIRTYKNVTTNDDLIMEKYKLDFNADVDNSIFNLESKIQMMEDDIEIIAAQIDNSYITAPVDGLISMTRDVTEGDLLQGGMELAYILPESESDYIISLQVPNNEISKLQKGQEIRCKFLSLPYREYGEATGTIMTIGVDAKMEQGSDMSYYPVEARLDTDHLYNHRGIRANIKTGMICEAQVITGSKKILYWLLEKIDLRD